MYRSIADRFEEKVVRLPDAPGCWIWTASVRRGGYGQILAEYPDRRILTAHQVAYRLYRGPIPYGLILDHLCRLPECVNPWHLQPVSFRENVLRGFNACADNARKTHCRFHPDQPLVVMRKSLKNRRLPRGCKECQRDRKRDRRENAVQSRF